MKPRREEDSSFVAQHRLICLLMVIALGLGAGDGPQTTAFWMR